jgi:hypothetical protein
MSKQQFKVGDRVRRIGPSRETHGLVSGREYTVTYVSSPTGTSVGLEGVRGRWGARWFELVARASPFVIQAEALEAKAAKLTARAADLRRFGELARQIEEIGERIPQSDHHAVLHHMKEQALADMWKRVDAINA